MSGSKLFVQVFISRHKADKELLAWVHLIFVCISVSEIKFAQMTSENYFIYFLY